MSLFINEVVQSKSKVYMYTFLELKFDAEGAVNVLRGGKYFLFFVLFVN